MAASHSLAVPSLRGRDQEAVRGEFRVDDGVIPPKKRPFEEARCGIPDPCHAVKSNGQHGPSFGGELDRCEIALSNRPGRSPAGDGVPQTHPAIRTVCQEKSSIGRERDETNLVAVDDGRSRGLTGCGYPGPRLAIGAAGQDVLSVG